MIVVETPKGKRSCSYTEWVFRKEWEITQHNALLDRMRKEKR
tara:strand:- start:15611 stop:15736 length:126 start_codon:yes stop_codon:yes gene_type:complete